MKIHAFVREVAPRVISGEKGKKGKLIFHCNVSGIEILVRQGLVSFSTGVFHI